MTDIPPAGEPPAAVAEGSEPQLTGVAEAKTWPVTIVFADVVDSTRLSGQLGKGAYTSIMERFQQEGRRIVREHGGWAKAAGDAVIGIFGVPVKLNDALQRKWGVKVGVRIGVHTDEALVRVPTGTPLHDVKQDDRVDVLDEVANLAQRLQANAEQGQILIGQATYQRVRAWVTAERTREKLQLSGVDRHVPAWALFTVYSQPRLPSVPMVGRKDELSLLNLTFERARRSGRLHLVTVLGEAGVGKTRLVEEFVRGLGEDARVLRGQCQQHGSQQRGESVMYGPIMQMLQQAAEIPAGLSPDAIRSRLRPLAGDDPHRAAQLASLLWVRDSAAEPEGTLRALREALQLLARQRPLVLVIDDLQWARGTLLDFIEDLSVSLQNDAILVVCVARSQFIDDQPAWGTRHNSIAFEMLPLETGEVEELVRHLLSDGQPDPELLQYIQARQDHSPLSIQLLAAVLVEDKFIVLKSGRWRAPRSSAPRSCCLSCTRWRTAATGQGPGRPSSGWYERPCCARDGSTRVPSTRIHGPCPPSRLRMASTSRPAPSPPPAVTTSSTASPIHWCGRPPTSACRRSSAGSCTSATRTSSSSAHRRGPRRSTCWSATTSTMPTRRTGSTDDRRRLSRHSPPVPVRSWRPTGIRVCSAAG